MPGQKFGPAWFPGLIALGLLVCGAGLAFSAKRQVWVEFPAWLSRPRPVPGAVSGSAGWLCYVLAAGTVGFCLTAFVIQVVWMRVLGASWRLTLPIALIATVVIHLSFYKLLRIPLPWGIFERFAF